MRIWKWLPWLLLAFASIARAQTSPIQDWCEGGSVKAQTQGLQSTNTLQGSYPRCTVTVYITGTATRATIYADSSNTPLTNPFTANTNGSFTFWAASVQGYDITVSGGIPIPLPQPFTYINRSAFGGAGSICSFIGSVCLNPSGNQTVTQPPGTTLEVNNINGVVYANGYLTLADALVGCPSTGGCVINALGASTNTVVGPFDPGQRSVTLFAGPYLYTDPEFTFRTNMQVIGVGVTNDTNLQPTVFQVTNAAVSPFQLPTTGSLQIQHVVLSKFKLVGTGSGTQNGIDVNAAWNVAEGLPSSLNNSDFDNLQINGFGGKSINMTADDVCGTAPNTGSCANSAIIQFINLHHVYADRNAGGQPSLYIEGQVGQFTADGQSEFDSAGYPNTNDGLTNVAIYEDPTITAGVGPFPYNITFRDVTNQESGIAYDIAGAVAVSILQGHFENCNICIRLNTGAEGFKYSGEAAGNWFSGNDGVNGGSGALVYAVTSSDSAFRFHDNQSDGAPDAYLSGTNAGVIQAAFPSPVRNFCTNGGFHICPSDPEYPTITNLTATTWRLNMSVPGIGDGLGDIYRDGPTAYHIGSSASVEWAFGGTTNSYPAFITSPTAIEAVLADQSGFINFRAAGLQGTSLAIGPCSINSSGVLSGCSGGPTSTGFSSLVSGTVTVTSSGACNPGTSCSYSLTNCEPSGTAIGTLSVGTIVAGTSFVVNSLTSTATVATGDTSGVCWKIN